MDNFRSIKLLLTMILILILFNFGNADTEKIPIDLGDDKFEEIGKAFVSYLSDELKDKLSNKTDEDSLIDMNSEDYNNLSPEEKKEVESALMKAFEPIFGEFANMISESGIPKEAIQIETKTMEMSDESEEQHGNKNKEKYTNKQEL